MRVSINDEILKDIANSIRSKTDSVDLMHPQQMSGNIDGITVSKTQSKSVTITQNGTETITPDTSYNGLSSVEVTTAVPLQTKSVTITSNGVSTITPDTNYEGMTSVEINTNVSLDTSDYFYSTAEYTNIGNRLYSAAEQCVKQLPPLTLTGDYSTYANGLFGFLRGITALPIIDLSNVVDMTSMCLGCANLTNLSNVTFPTGYCLCTQTFQNCTSLTDLSSYTFKTGNSQYMFGGCSSLTGLPKLDLRPGSTIGLYGVCMDCTSLVTIPSDFLINSNNNSIHTMNMGFYGCTNLVNVPDLAIPNVVLNSGLVDTFKNCPNLSNDSLNNIMAICTRCTNVSAVNKTLAKVGLSQTQATTCMGLSNYTAFTNAGWTTGY